MCDFNGTIQQIIPATPGLFEKGTDPDGTEWKMPIVCFALVCDENGNQNIIPCSMDSYGDIDSALGNLIEWEPTEEGDGEV